MPGFQGLHRILQMSREAAHRGGLTVKRQLLEMLVLKIARDLGPNYYHAGRFWRPEIPFRDKWRHANEREYDRLLLTINPLNYRKASQHKVLEKAILNLFGIPTPRFIGFFHSQRGGDSNAGDLRNLNDLSRVLKPYGGCRVCFKAVEGYGGRSFAALDVADDGASLWHPISGRRWSLPEWCHELMQSPDGWLLEEYLQQHPDLAAINPSSVNTLRIWLIERHTVIHATHAILRIGRAGSQVDNATSGGIACPVDMKTGCLQNGLDLKLPYQTITRHPDSGAPLAGLQVPFWRETIALGARALSIFPKMRFAGIDAAITINGPAMIELNVIPDRISALRWDLPHKDYFEPALN